MAFIHSRPILAPVVGAALCILSARQPNAALREPVAHLSGRAISVTDHRPEARIDILIDRWSTDDEWTTAREAMMRGGPLQLLDAFHHLRERVGVVLMPGVGASGARSRQRTPRNLLFAREVRQGSGRRLMFIGDQHFGFGESRLEARLDRDEFTLLDVRFEGSGAGVGKVATEASVRLDTATEAIEIENFGAQPARLVDVRVEGREGAR